MCIFFLVFVIVVEINIDGDGSDIMVVVFCISVVC